MKQLTISLITYNSKRFVRDFAQSLLAQTFTDYEIIVIDNASTDSSLSLVRACLPQAHVVEQTSNIGFSRAHNLSISWSKSPFIALINPDIVMHVDCLEYLMRVLQDYEDAGSVGPKHLTGDSISPMHPDIVDSTGLTLNRSYKVTNRHHGKQSVREERIESVFGISGSFVIYRRTALEDVKEPRSYPSTSYEYLDEDFFLYKEDADLAWRMLNAGWKHYYVPPAVCYHYRGIAEARDSWTERKLRSAINRYSYRNHIAMILKNHHWPLTLRYSVLILWFELQKFVYLFILDRSSVRGLMESMRFASSMLRKRAYLKRVKRLHWREFMRYVA